MVLKEKLSLTSFNDKSRTQDIPEWREKNRASDVLKKRFKCAVISRAFISKPIFSQSGPFLHVLSLTYKSIVMSTSLR